MKGSLYTLEVGISILMILFFIIFLYLNPPTSPEYTELNHKMKTYKGLQVLEQTGLLRKYVKDNNITAINESLEPYILGYITRAVVIFNDTTNLTVKPSLSSVNDSISVSYFLAGDFDDYNPREVTVYMWGY